MMDLNLWTEDFFLPQDLGLDFLDDQKDGQYGDLKDGDRLCGSWKQEQHEDVVEQPLVLSNESSLDDMGWMESNIGSLLDALAAPHELSLPELSDVSASLSSNIVSQFHQAVPSDILNSNMYPPVYQDSMLTPPESPEQVLPVIQLEAAELQDSVSPASPPNFLSSGKDIFQDSLDFSCIALPEESLNVDLQDSVDFIGSPLSADEVESMLSYSQPASPKNESHNTSNLILSSPELYKIIAVPSSISHRFSPYSKQKLDQKPKSPRSSRAKKAKAEADDLVLCEVPDHLNKKDKKRLQNKNAAIRYRQKKKEESQTIHSEVDVLESRNQELTSKVEDLEREVRYMKNLMHDIQKAKGLS